MAGKGEGSRPWRAGVVESVSDAVEKPAQDGRLYRALRLCNGMRVLLVSDVAAEKAAAAMNVSVGHWSDPEDIPGVAHFLEHMLFLGTEKYPDENHYSAFLSSHGGSSNAYTSAEDTNFYFDVAAEHLAQALDAFAQFFLAPLMNEGATEREMSNVDSENSNNLFHDAWRYQQLRNSMAHARHPMHKFGTGSCATLQQLPTRDTRQALLDFHERHYRAPNMSLCLLGRESLDQLEEWACSMFAGVRSDADDDLLKFVAEDGSRLIPLAFTSEQVPHVVRMQTVKDLRSVRMVFPLPSDNRQYLKKEARYMSHLVGHEGPGSIFRLLQKKGWATELAAGLLLNFSDVRLFGVDISLTPAGLEHVDDVVAVTTSYLRLVRNSGLPQWIYDECSHIAEMEFRFKDKTDTFNYVPGLAASMSRNCGYADEHIISASYRFGPFNEEDLKALVDMLVPENMLVFIGAKDHPGHVLEEKEQWYGTVYSRTRPSPAQAQLWSDPPQFEALHLPSANPFIPEDFSVIGSRFPEDGKAAEPTMAASNERYQLWHKVDDTFLQPKANLFFKIHTPVAYEDVAASVYTQLFIHMLEEELNEVTYNASVASINFVLEPSTSGLILALTGFTPSVFRLAKIVFERLSSFQIEPACDAQRISFESHKERLHRKYVNFKNNQPYQLAQYSVQLATYRDHWPIFDRLAIFPSVSIEGLQEFRARLFKEAKVDSLAHGNIDKETAVSLLEQLVSSLDFAPLGELRNQQMVRFPTDEVFALDTEHGDGDAPNSAVTCLWQLGSEEHKTNAVGSVIGNIVSEPCFDSLRTKQNLGYIVWSGVRQSFGVLLFRVIVQSPNKDPLFLQARIEDFVREMRETVASLSQQELENHISSLVAIKSEPERDLTQESNRLWDEISDKTFCFNRREFEIRELRAVSKEDLLTFYDTRLLSGSGRLVARVFKHGSMAAIHAGAPERVLLDDTARSVIAELPCFPNPSPSGLHVVEASL